MGVPRALQASVRPSMASLNCHITSGFSGLPKFRQFVAAMGRAPVQATLRAASTTACIAPRRGSREHQRPLPSVARAIARLVSFSRSTAASPDPGPMRVFVRTIESYCSVIQYFDAIVGEASNSLKFSVSEVPSAAKDIDGVCLFEPLVCGAAIGRL